MTKLSLNQTNVNSDPKFSKMLDSLQANILKGHGRKFAHHLFFQFDEAKKDEAKKWISKFANNYITNATKQILGSKLYKEENLDAGPILTLSLSSLGYDILGLAASKPISSSFNNGMRASSSLLGDDESKYDLEFKEVMHMLIIVADEDPINAKDLANHIISQVAKFGTLHLNQRGNVLKKDRKTGIEHFGYADGISQPLYLEKDIEDQASIIEWDDATTLNLLLAEDPGAPDSFGSFLVFRKLEQNVKKFKTKERYGLPIIKDVNHKDNDELAGAMLVGRFENGVPIVKNSSDLSEEPINDFDYSDDLLANKCPFHSHVRLMNPRNGDPEPQIDLNSHRITRRGIPYDDVNRISIVQIENITNEILDGNLPETGVGLLFMCYQSNISNQFEVLQGFWANKGEIGPHDINAEDSLISQGANPQKTLPAHWGKDTQTDQFSFGNFVTTKGGEYFFTPSISFLKSL